MRTGAYRKTSPPGSAPRRAFTLIEILCVVVILGIASAVILPQIGTHDDLTAAAASRVLMSDLMYAQSRAISSQKKHFVQFAGQQYTVLARDSDTSSIYTLTNPVSNDTYSQTFGSSNTTLATAALGTENFGGSTVLGFDELGSPFAYTAASNTCTALTSSGTVTVSSGKALLTISIEPYTGEISVN